MRVSLATRFLSMLLAPALRVKRKPLGITEFTIQTDRTHSRNTCREGRLSKALNSSTSRIRSRSRRLGGHPWALTTTGEFEKPKKTRNEPTFELVARSEGYRREFAAGPVG